MSYNKSYVKGRAKEYRIKKQYEKIGWEVIRSSGSHGFADLVCINKLSKRIKFVQCKSKSFSKKQEEKLLKEYDWLKEGIFLTEFEITK